MNILYCQPGFPGQYRHLMRALAAEGGHRQVFLHDAALPPAERIEGVEVLAYPSPPQAGDRHPLLADLDGAIRRAEAVRRLAEDLGAAGFRPEVVCAHGGYGEGLFLKEVFPEARLVAFMEYYYGAGGLLGSDPDFAPADPVLARIGRVRNALAWMTFEVADRMTTPTRWQHGLFPPAIRGALDVVHDGIDTDRIRPDPGALFALPDGTVLRPGDPVVTFSARALEPLRGVHVLLRALPRVLAARPNTRVVLAGRDGAAYGPAGPAAGGESAFARLLREEVGGDPRVHVLSWQPHAALIRLFQVSAAHVYASLPFVLSWSVPEAMAAGALLVAADTAPVREFVRHGETGLLFHAGDSRHLAETLIAAVDAGPGLAPVRHAARARIRATIDLRRTCLPALRSIVETAAQSPKSGQQTFDAIHV